MPARNTISNAMGMFLYSAGAGVAVAPCFYGTDQYLGAAEKIKRALKEAEVEQGETRPTEPVISGITAIIEEVSRTKALPSEPDVSAFYGEALVTWRCAGREISLLSRGNPDDPKLLRYEAGQGQPSDHRIVRNATVYHLNEALGWLYE